MYASVGSAIAAMIHWQERQRSPRGTPWPDHAPGAASHADPWKYIYVHGTRPVVSPLQENEKDPEIVAVLFARYDRRRVLTRIFLEGQSIEDFKATERRKARRSKNRFIRELCHRGLLMYPQKGCFENVRIENSSCPRRCRARKEFP